MAGNGKAYPENDCAKFRKLISAYVDNETGSLESESVSEHIAACPLCKRELANLYSVRDMVKSVYAPKEKVDFSSSIMARINASCGVRKKTGKSADDISVRILKYGMVAALVFIALGSTVFYSQAQTKKLMAEKRKFDTYVVEHSIQTAVNSEQSRQVITVNFEK